MDQVELIELKNILKEDFNLDELRDLCFHLNISYEDLEGTTIGAKCISLVDYTKRHGRIEDLINAGRASHPNSEWIDIKTSDSKWATEEPPASNKNTLTIFSILAAILGFLLTIAWLMQDCGYEPLLALIASLIVIFGVFSNVKKSRSLDLIFSVVLIIVGIGGSIYLNGYDCCSSPKISGVIANPTTVKSGEISTLTVFVKDQNNEPLSYDWSAAYGQIESGNQGATNEYTSPLHPKTGHDTITVSVNNGAGCKDEKSIQIAIEK